MSSRWLITAMCCAGAVTAQFVSGKATRDALFLASLDFTSLPAMLVATSMCSILLVAANAVGSRRIAPGRMVPAAFAVSGLLFLAEWLLTRSFPSAAAVLVYLHVSGAGPVLASGFWLITSERFDPRTAKKRFGQIAGAGTIGGLMGALLAERVAAVYGVAAMLPVLAAFQFAAAWLVQRLSGDSRSIDALDAADEAATLTAPQVSGLRLVVETPYLRNLAALVLLGTTAAALVDYLFKARAVETFGRGDLLMRFFASYYAATSLVTFIVQATSSRKILERFGLALTTSTPSLMLLAGGLGHVVAPGFASLIAARGGESTFRGSLFRSGYELFYTPIPSREKRSAKSIIDVAFDRLGDALGGGLVRALLVLSPAMASSAILAVAMACSALAILVASRLNRGYISTLEHSLMHRGAGIDTHELHTTRAHVAVPGNLRRSNMTSANVRANGSARDMMAVRPIAIDPDVQDILHLRSRDRERVADVLARQHGLSPILVPHVIPLLAWEPVAEHAVFALRKVAEDRVGELVDALLDPNQDFSVRRRLARVFSVCVSQRAADGLMFGLEDSRFDVRFQSARSLSSLVDKNPMVRIHRESIEAAVLREVAVGRPVWESRRVLDEADVDASTPAVDAYVRDRAGESLAHVFTLLSLILPREPLQIAFRSLHTDDQYLQGTALEYLDGMLPPRIRHGLWPFLEPRTRAARSSRPRNEVIAELLRSNHSILMNLEELKRRSADALADTTA